LALIKKSSIMETLLKQCVGIDISKLTFTACVCRKFITGKQEFSNVETFTNNKKGFNQLIKWSRKITRPGLLPVVFLMEATGVYYESLAYRLHMLELPVCVLLPNKVNHYAKSLNVKTKTDAVDARIISQMGIEQSHSLWTPSSPIYKELKQMTRYYSALKKEHSQISNHLEALLCGERPSSFVSNSYKKLLSDIEKETERCVQAIRKLIAEDPVLSAKIEKLETIKGVGFITIVIVIAETQGFELVSSRKQLASYAGFDVVERQSGTSIKGRTRISKKGNSRIRAALYFPAMISSMHNPVFKEDYQRINEGKCCKKIGVTALQRKLLLLIYTLWKNGETFKVST